MSKYAFAGLTVDSEIPLPELPNSSHACPADAVVGVGDVCVPPAHQPTHVWRDPLDKVAFVSGRVEDDWYIEFPGALKVLIAPDGGVTVQPDAGSVDGPWRARHLGWERAATSWNERQSRTIRTGGGAAPGRAARRARARNRAARR